MMKIAVRHIMCPIDVLIECIKHDPKSMGLDICVDKNTITLGNSCTFGKVVIMLNRIDKSHYIPLQCVVTFENNQMHVEAYSWKGNLVDKDHYYTATYDLETPVKLVNACQNINTIFRILAVYVENLKAYAPYKDAEDYAAYAISNTIDSFKSYFEPVT